MKITNIMKKTLLTVVTTVTALCTIGLTNAYAKTASTGNELLLGLEQYRTSGYSYKWGDKIAWKISSYSGATVNKDRTFYCIKGGPGFGSTSHMGDSGVTKRTYSEYFDLKDYASIDTTYKAVLPTGEKYNSLVYLLNHIYVAPQLKAGETLTTAQQQERADFLAAYIKNSDYSKLTNDEIDTAQQLAVWYFTNDDIYKVSKTDTNGNVIPGTFTLSIKNSTDANYDSLGNYFGYDGDNKNDAAVELFQNLVNQAEANKAVAPIADTNPITFTSNLAKRVVDGSNYVVGPFKITENTANSIYSLELLVKSSGEASATNIGYTLLDSSKNATTKTIKQLVGQDFYLSIPTTQNLDTAKITLNVGKAQTNITYWSVSGVNAGVDQPVVEITEEDKKYPVTVDVPKDYVFDLALRKFITKINNVAVTTSREPIISSATISNLKNETITTTTKEHTKNPLAVATGDTVLYTIRIYNEGELNGFATEVTDYLPSGLTLKAGSTINTTYGWTNPSGDGKTIVTSYLANKLINKFNGTTLAYQDLQVECTVTATASTAEQHLKNVAEITKDADEDGNEVNDRDSTPGNLSNNQKDNYNPGESEKGWGYEDDDDYEDLVIPASVFDLALRKFITNINGVELVNSTTGKYQREPSIDLSTLKNGTSTTAIYNHRKDPVGVAVGDIVIYTIRVYNEGELDGYASSVTDYLPPQLEFVIDDSENFNAKYGWLVDSTLRKATTTYLESNGIDDENLIKAFNGTTLDYKELKVKCRVKSTKDLDKVITNIAEITDFTDANGNTIADRDSQEDNVILPTDENLPDYKGNDSNKSVLSDENYFYKGQQDDDDFDKLILQEFDLALRKFITKVNDTAVTNRIPTFTKVKDENGNYIYEHTKEPIGVETTDIVEYTIRIYNEGDINGYAKEVTDDIPSGLQFLPDNATNKEYRWVMYKADGTQTLDVTQAKSISTDYLSKEQADSTGRDNLIEAFDQNTMTSPNYKDVKVAFKVIAPNSYSEIITNIAEITDDSDENGKDINDKDSTPDNGNEKEDDIDKEHIKLQYFDLALRKFITAVNDTSITNRVPVFKIDENGNYVYEHTKEPVEVENGNIVTYTLRIFNEGTKDGYAKEVKDDLPEGLLFLPENDINKEYRWVMLDKDGKETQKVEEAVSIKTDYLSKEQADSTGRDNLLKAFDEKTMEQPNYRDIKIAFKVTEPNTSDRILINSAQISDDSDKNGNDVVDKDSTPDKWIEGEDDQDIEKVKVKYFDLALRKWVTQAIVIENGKETITETGHKAEDDPEAPVKVEIVAGKINKVVVKFRYKIRITNEGEIAGYAKEISDYIPAGLKFVAADNPQWKEVDGKITTDQLKDTLLQPGETAEVEVLLTWINGKDNMGLKVNVAEISEDYNDSHTPDIDSTPNNKKDGEDDIDDAPVILSVKTGEETQTTLIAGITAGALVILVGGAVFIKKFVL